ncbi:amp-ligase [Moniliophthora roreri]|uniref:AMP-dependent synthetase/ligase domain-containing protein n=1 Tax=Moniliophthora roreri TaxID=221103 RepID=A0A0W0FIZ9_MONRR|nr:amp-ligase [Moniliophthora roreri]
MPQTHLTALEEAVSRNSSATVFQVPVIDTVTARVTGYNPISVGQFAQDVDAVAKYWVHVLKKAGIPTKSVIAVCLGGLQYIDVVNVYSVARAGYILHSFSRLPGIAVVRDLLQKSETKAFIRHTDVKEALKDIQDIPVYDPVTSTDDLAAYAGNHLSPMSPQSNENDIAVIFHTSGSISGSPKLVTGTYRWLEALIQKHAYPLFPKHSRVEVMNWMGNVCHLAQFAGIIRIIQTGGCMVQMKSHTDEKEILAAIDLASLTGLTLVAPLLVKILGRSKADRDVLSSLANLDGKYHNIGRYVTTGGGRNIFGITEPGGLMAASLGTRIDPLNTFRPLNIPGLSHQFVPISTSREDPHSQLLELVVLPESIDCPDPKFLDRADGCFHSGDLWKQVENGYTYCGRDDDWIKSANASRCDTRAIEDNVRQTCGDLVSDCIVVGSMRPSPVLFIESKTKAGDADLKESIFKRIEPFHSQRLAHERITSSDMIVVVPSNTLPRTAKGTIRRRAVEEVYKETLDQLYDD